VDQRSTGTVVAATYSGGVTTVDHPGSALGLPKSGPGSVASMGLRIGAFVLDLVVSFLVALAFTRPELPQNWSLVVWLAMTVFAVGLFGSTPGQVACGIRVAPLGGRAVVGLWAIPRTALTFVIVPVLVTNADGRGWHDRICRTVVIRSR
jgi:uncharacterized RDD family membrane protein YckC